MGDSMAMEKKKSDLELKLDEPVARVMKNLSFQEVVSFNNESSSKKAADWLKTLNKYKEGKLSFEVSGKDLILRPGMKDMGFDSLLSLPATDQEAKAFDDFINSMKQKDNSFNCYSVYGIKKILLKANADVIAELKTKGYELTENEKLKGFYSVDKGPGANVFTESSLNQKASEETPTVGISSGSKTEVDLGELNSTTNKIVDKVAAGKQVDASLKERYYALVNKLVPSSTFLNESAEARGKRKAEEELGYPAEKQQLAVQYAAKVKDILVRRDKELAVAEEKGKEAGRKEVMDKYGAEIAELKSETAKLREELERVKNLPARVRKTSEPKSVPKPSVTMQVTKDQVEEAFKNAIDLENGYRWTVKTSEDVNAIMSFIENNYKTTKVKNKMSVKFGKFDFEVTVPYAGTVTITKISR